MARGPARRDQLAKVFKEQDLLKKMEAILADSVEFSNITVTITVFAPNLKTGDSQVAAGAGAGEMWVDTADQSIKLGV